MQVRPDWSKQYDISEFEKEFGLKFDGPGMYLSKTDTVLVVPMRPNEQTTQDNIWHYKQPEGTLWDVSVFNVPFSQTIFGASSFAPTRHDTR